ncbi:MAG: hypothetical protein ACLRL6_19150, partial [Clostridium sp.]
QRSVDEKKEDTRGQEVKPDAEKPLLKTPKEDISRQAKGTEDKTAKAKQQAAADSILQAAGKASKQQIPKQTGKQRLRKRHAVKKALMEQRKAADDEELLPIVYKQKHQKPAGPTNIQQEIQEHPDAQGSMYRNQRIRRSHWFSIHPLENQSQNKRLICGGGATFTQAELQDILIAINTNEEESDQDTATASPAKLSKKKEQYHPNEHPVIDTHIMSFHRLYGIQGYAKGYRGTV